MRAYLWAVEELSSVKNIQRRPVIAHAVFSKIFTTAIARHVRATYVFFSSHSDPWTTLCVVVLYVIVLYRSVWESVSQPFVISSISSHLRHLADDIFKCNFIYGNSCILNDILLKFVHNDLILLAISRRWFRLWLGAQHAPVHYMSQCWLILLTQVCVTLPLIVSWNYIRHNSMNPWKIYQISYALISKEMLSTNP